MRNATAEITKINALANVNVWWAGIFPVRISHYDYLHMNFQVRIGATLHFDIMGSL